MQLGSPQKLTRGNANVALMTDKQYSVRDNYVRQSTHYLIVKHAQTSLFKYAEKVEGDFSLSNSSCFSKKMFGLNQDRKCFIAILFVPIALNFYRIFNFPRFRQRYIFIPFCSFVHDPFPPQTCVNIGQV